MTFAAGTIRVLILATLVVVLWVAAAAGSAGNSRVARQAFQATRANAATSSRTFQKLPGLSLLLGNRGSTVSSTFGGTFSGAPVEVRVRVGTNGPVLEPGAARFDPSSGKRSFSFSLYIIKTPCAKIKVEWRSTSGQRVSFDRGNLIALYRPLSGTRYCQ